MRQIIADRVTPMPVERSVAGGGQTATVRLRSAIALGAVLSVMAAAAQMIPLPMIIRAAVTLLFALVVPGATLITVLLLCGVGVRHGRTVSFRLSLVVLSALVIPLSMSVLIAAAQLMLWLGVWRPAEAIVLLAGLSMPILLAGTVFLTAASDVGGAHPSPAGDRADDSEPPPATAADVT